jgi:Rad3-related DNA helicase
MTQASGQPISAAVRQLAGLVEQAGRGLTAAELTTAAQSRFPGQHPRRIGGLIEQALRAGALVQDGALLRMPEPSPAEAATPAARRPIRAVVVDLESVVRPTAAEPYTDKRIFQIGAVRMGTDSAWTAAQPTFGRFLELPDGDWEIRSDQLRDRHQAEAFPAAEGLSALHDMCSGADMLVAYNGAEADFPLLAQAYEREQMPTLDPVPVDAYYLALALWPAAASHRLAVLADALGVNRDGLSWHDAVDDCILLQRLLEHAGHLLAGWHEALVDLAASACPDSPAWTLLRHLAGQARGLEPGHALGATAPRAPAEVSAVLSAHLSGHTPRRHPGGTSAARGAIQVGAMLRGPDGRVDPVLLAAIAHGSDARRRAAQEEMTSALHRWADAGVPALIEAPTGTGKSFAVLAAALDWLAGAPERTAIVTTFTKQLQQQLADDVARLDAVIPGLLDTSDVVKGQSNRLSLRALTAALADSTTETAASAPAQGGRNRFLARPQFRELLVFLALRLLAAADAQASWAAHSVDPVDVPPFFAGYAGPVLPVWLESLSQASNGEYPAGAATPLASHTDAVREALAAHRLLVANHALLLAHLDDLDALGPDTLLIVDEAHQLEDAATGALTTAIDYRAVEDLFAEVDAWARSARPGTARESVREAAGNLGILLDHEHLPRVAGMAFDARGTGAGVVVGSRTVTLASAYAGTAGVPQVRQLAALLVRLGGQCEALVGALGCYYRTHQASLDFFAAERVQALLARCAALRDSAQSIVADMDAIIGPASGQGQVITPVADGNGSAPDRQASEDPDGELPPGTDVPDDPGVEDDPEGTAGRDSRTVLGELPVGTSNRVVYAEELGVLREGLRRYRFRVASSPVELAADATWQQFLGTFARTYYVSATLRVSGRWQFIQARLGLRPSIATLALSSPFRLGEQAELVCLSDFPSWAEQSDGAMRTVAHQLAGYAREVVQPVPAPRGGEAEPGGRGGFDGGALVLTTARSTAGGIADYLATELRQRGDQTPVLSALVLGNNRGYREFTDSQHGGGFLVGTKGLWQGVDVADERRLGLVWINKVPFAPFAAPVIEARREAVKTRAEAARAEDPDAMATREYYLPLAALQLRQAAGRLIRSERHRGVIVISDRKLAGQTALRRAYRETFLGSLDDPSADGSAGLLRPDPVTGERTGGNVVPMAEGWARIWSFLAGHGLLTADRAAELSTPKALEEHTLLPQTRRIRALAMTGQEVGQHRAAGTLGREVAERAAVIGGLLRLSDTPADLKPSQLAIIEAATQGRNVLGLLPTGFGKSFCFQLPALVLPGVTLVISPLVALMHDQALELNRSIGGAVRALVAPLRESSSRAGKTEVADQLLGRADHGIRMVYVSPERLCQRRFRDVVRQAVAAGTVTRIAVDEAHTFVQWDDFRPSMSRVGQFLAELRQDFGLPVTALTATANRTVHAGLRESVLGLPPEPPGPAGEAAEARAGTLLTVRENPIRPELAIFRRSIRAAGPSITAGLAEEVLDVIEDHAILYCLTVKEVVAMHAHLREYLGEAGAQVRRFHGRLTEVEKSSVMMEFREAPRKGEEGFAPLIVVATSAFGLGVNRPDVRTVFCVSVPTDLAALYQQVGRAGRDVAGMSAAGPDTVGGDLLGLSGTGETASGQDGTSAQPTANVGLTLMTTRGLRTVAFMTGHDLPSRLLEQMGRAVLACGGVLDSQRVADDLIGADLAAGFLTADEARKSRTAEQYQSGVMRAFAALAELGAVEDLGDFPPCCAVKPGELLGLRAPVPPASRAADDTAWPGTDDEDTAEDAVVAAVLALPARDSGQGSLRRSRLDVAGLDAHLARAVPGFRTFTSDAAGTWYLLADLHDRGLLDVSAAPSRQLVTCLRVTSPELPKDFRAAVSGKAARAAEEIRLLRDFFRDSATCANRKLADYFEVTELPPGCCSHARNRCSACWDSAAWPLGESKPEAAIALETPRPKPAGQRTDAAYRQRRLDEQVSRLVWEVFSGVHPRDLFRALRGEDSYYLPALGRRVRLRSGLVTSRFFGASPAVLLAGIEDSLARLQAAGKITPSGPRWRDMGHVRREQARAARTAAQLATAGQGHAKQGHGG